jgi:hypothetical protein
MAKHVESYKFVKDMDEYGGLNADDKYDFDIVCV